jgi:hypothetical protein
VILASVLWLSGLVAIAVSFIQLRKLKIQVVRLADSRCSDLMMVCEKIKAAHPNYAGSFLAPTYLPNGTHDEAARAAIWGFNGRLADFSEDLLKLVKSTGRD